MNTYFFVQAIQASALAANLGPYLNFDEAAEVFMNHLDYFVPNESGYLAQISECIIIDHKQKAVNIRVTEKRGK